MKKYFIEKTIITPIRTFQSFNYDGYLFFTDIQKFNNFCVKKEVSAESYNEAYIIFIKGLVPIVNSLSLLTQCIIEGLSLGSFYIKRVRYPNNTIFLYHAKKNEPVGLDVTSETLEDLKNLSETGLTNSFNFIRESTSASTGLSRLAMLIVAAESLAGNAKKKRICDNCQIPYEYDATDEKKLEQIIGKELYNRLYRKDRIRHRLFHGTLSDDSVVGELNDLLYKAIIHKYLEKEYSLKSINKEAVSVPRSHSFEYTGNFLEVKKPELPSISEISNNWERDQDYTIINAPKDY